MPPSALLIDEDSAATCSLRDELRAFLPDFEVASASSTFRALHHLRSMPTACAIVAHPLRNDSAFRCVERLRVDHHDLVIVALSATPSAQQAVRFIRLGADDYAARSPHQARTVASKVRWLLERRSVAHAELAHAAARGAHDAGTDAIGRLPVPARVQQAVAELASSPLPVLVGGGRAGVRRRIAWALHLAGGRAAAPFDVIRCATLDRHEFTLRVEARLLGPPATAPSPSARDAARMPAGTLLLDGIEHLARPLQARLAVLLGGGSNERFGARCPTAMRVVAGSDLPLHDACAPTALCATLFHRIAVLTLSLPSPRRERDLTRRVHDLLRRLAATDRARTAPSIVRR